MSADPLNNTAAGKLRSLVDRIMRLEEDKTAVANDLKEVFAEAKGEGYDTKILRKVIRILKQDSAKRQEEEALIDLYLSAIGEYEVAIPTKAAKPEPPPRQHRSFLARPSAPEPPVAPLDSVEVAMAKGRGAWVQGGVRSDNPYPEGTDQRLAWDDGWVDSDADGTRPSKDGDA